MTPMNGLGIGTSKFTFLQPITNNYSIDLDGTDDHVNLGNSSTIKLTATDTSEGVGISIALWCKADDWNVTTVGPTINCAQNGGWKMDWSTRMVFTCQNDQGSSNAQSAYKPFESEADAHYRASGWHLIAGTFDGRNLKLYIDGTLETTTDVGSDDNSITYGTGNNNVDVLIGSDPNPLVGGESGTSPGVGFFPGLIDEVAIWDKVLDLEAVKEIFDAVDVDSATLNLTEDSGNYDYSDDLVGYWKFEEGTGTTTTDSSDNSNTGTLKNSPGWSATTPT
jgi:hypothetical protein